MIVATLDSLSQSRYLKFSHLTVDDGLSSNRIRCILKDSKMYLWLATDIGLDKYDSYQVKQYRNNKKQPGTISSDIVTCIYEDRAKNLWFGTYDGLNLYQPETDNFVVFKNIHADRNSINGNTITGITEDKLGNLWISTDGNCLNKWIPQNQNFIRYQFEMVEHDLMVRPSKMIAVDSKGYLWIASFSSVIRRFDPESGIFTEFSDPSIDHGTFTHKNIFIDNQDKLWVASDGSGFYSFDSETKKFKHFSSNGDKKGTNQNLILDILPEDDRYLLLAVDQGGINRFDKLTETFQYFMYNEANETGLNNNGIWCLYRDKEDILWVGTSGGGLNYSNPKSERFKLFTHIHNNPASLSYSFTGSFCEDYQGLIWIGTDGGGLNVYNPETGSFKIFKHDKSNPYSISGNVIRGIGEDKDHDIWIGTWNAGLNRYDRKTGRFFHYMPDKKNLSSISGISIYNLIIDHNNVLWLSIFNEGIDLYKKDTGVFKRFRPDPQDPGSLSGINTWCYFEDSKKNMWICTQKGLNRYDTVKQTFKVYNFPDNDIGAFYKDKRGYIWVGTSTKGLFMCNEDGTILKTYDMTNILPNNRIHAITEDNKGDIWISSNNGISMIDPEIQSVRYYSKEDGLQGDQFYQQSFLKTRKGELYFGGYNGFNSFFPDSLKDNDFIPPVYITDMQIFNKPVVYGVPGAQFQTQISEAKEIRLNWDQSVFSFSFVAINYTHPKKNQYSYKMEGFEKDWNYTDASRRYVTYTNLDPGEYTFKVRASNNDGAWNDEGASLKIIILPPFWKTLWFKLILISLIILIFVVFFIFRIRQFKKRQIILEKTVASKTSELRELNVSKDKFFSIIAHDLKNPFSSIIGLSQILKEEIKSGDTATLEDYAEMLNTSAIQTYRLLENLLEWANSQRGKISFNPVEIKLSQIFNEEFIVLREMAKAKNIEIKSLLDDDLTILADRNMIKTILRNLISNAIKFTNKNGKVEVKAFSDHTNVEISVSDNGIGMTKETIGKLFRLDGNLSTRGTEDEKGTGLGLFLCKEFIEKHGGRIWAESEEGKGSTFKFILPQDITNPRHSN